MIITDRSGVPVTRPFSGTAKPVFLSPYDARLALNSDRLGCVYHRAGRVYVVTAYGSGDFSAADWKATA